MTGLNDLMDELKVKIEQLLSNAKEEGFKAGKEAGVLKSIETLRNLDSNKKEGKTKIKRKYKKKIKVQEKPESVTKKKTSIKSVIKMGKTNELTVRGKLKAFIDGLPDGVYTYNDLSNKSGLNSGYFSSYSNSKVIEKAGFKQMMIMIDGTKRAVIYKGVKINSFKARIINKDNFQTFSYGVKNLILKLYNNGFGIRAIRKDVKDEYDLELDVKWYELDKLIDDYEDEKSAQIKELDSKEEVYPEQLYKPKPLIVSEPKKEYEEPDPAEIEMNLKIIRKEGAKKPSREWIPCKVCGNNTPGWGDNGGVCKKCRGKEVLKPKKKEEVKPKLKWIPCVICGGKIKEAKRDGNVCKTCRGEANEFSVSTVSKMGNYNIRCKECSIGKPKKEFRGSYGVCKACRGLK